MELRRFLSRTDTVASLDGVEAMLVAIGVGWNTADKLMERAVVDVPDLIGDSVVHRFNDRRCPGKLIAYGRNPESFDEDIPVAHIREVFSKALSFSA